MNKHILVTGGSGFVGSALIKRLLSEHRDILAVGRSDVNLPVETVKVSSFSELGALGQRLGSIDVVVHCAARAHIMNDNTVDPLAEYRKVNVDGSLNVARHALEAGVKRFLFVSSIKVNGEHTPPGRPFTEEAAPAPEDPYGISKYEAERELQALCAETDMELVIIRPPLVYGPGVKGNFASMIRLMEKGLPLPLGAVRNKRSLVALDNLVDLIVTCVDSPAAANQVFLAADGQDISTTELLRNVANAMGKPARLLPVPSGLLMLGASLFGKNAVAKRLLGSLQVDISKARELLGWQPPVSVEEGLARAVRVN
ncbi:SDR family oxidoreductase [Marinobacter sp.]|uniref:UDP-glucose 4-epimerase family protein n=1 Tax=Marinobacter sp. TaxID=50741 RepID=UPI000C40532E|nr:SDR family oxidoreductase [Marinobacter sp.]MAC23643.1 nucleoside-diphosphate sugar epimerase [Marinobacter sp.]MBH92653.1 nucleoside-diphosphate sugar epimerase [Marinobacter sp.]